MIGGASKPPSGVGGAKKVGLTEAEPDGGSLRIRNALQMKLAETSFAVDGEGEQKMLAWIGRYSKAFGEMWASNHGLREAIIRRWDSEPAWCLAEVRRQWRGEPL